MADDCGVRLLDPKVKKALFGDREISDRTMNTWLDDVQAIKEAFDQGLLSKGEFNSKTNAYIQRQRLNAETEAAVDLADLQIQKQLARHIRQEGFKGKEYEGISSTISKTNILGNEGALSVEAKAAGRMIKYTDHIRNSLEGTGLLKVALSDALDDEVAKVVFSLNEGKEVPGGLRPESVTIGKAYHEAMTLAFMDMRDAGLPAQHMKQRVTMQTHDPVTVKEAGFDKWANDVMSMKPNTDVLGPKSLTPEGMRDILKSIYTEIIAGRYGSLAGVEDGRLVNAMAPGNVSDKALATRTLVFDAENSMKYLRQYGGDTSLKAAIARDLSSKAQRMSMFERFGNTPRKSLESAIDKLTASLEKTDPQASKALEAKRPLLLQQFDTLAGTLSNPASETLGRFGQALRSLQSVSKLGLVPFRSMANLAGAMVSMQSTTGMSMADSIHKISLDTAARIPESVRATYMSDFKDVLGVMNSEMRAKMSGGGVPGAIAKAADFQGKFLGANFMNDLIGAPVTMLHTLEWGRNAKVPFTELEPRLQASLLSMGITKAEWRLMPEAVRPTENGKFMVPPESFGRDANFSPELVKSVMEERGIKGNDQGKFLRQIEDNMRAFFYQQHNIATTTATIRENALLSGGTQAGTPVGEFIRTMMQFKSFTAQGINIMRTFMNSRPDAELLARGVLKSDPKLTSTLGYIGQFVVAGTAIAYLADSMARVINGKDTKPVNDVNTWLDAMGKSGAGGMQVDLFTGEWGKAMPHEKPRYNFGEAILGPTLGDANKVAGIVTNLRQGEPQRAAQDATAIARSYIPFQSVVGVHRALDFVQRNTIDEMLNPGSSEKRKLRELRSQREGR